MNQTILTQAVAPRVRPPISPARILACLCLSAVFALAALFPRDAAAQFRAPPPGERPRTGFREPAPAPAPLFEMDANSCGCVRAGPDLEALLSALNLRDRAFEQAFRAQAPDVLPRPDACTPYAMTLDRKGELQTLALHVGGDARQRGALITLSRDLLPGTVLLQSEPIGPLLDDITSITATWGAVMSPGQDVRTAFPPEVLSELRTLAPMLFQPRGGLDDGHYLVRAAFDPGNAMRWSRLLSVEVIERASGAVVAETFWIDRGDLPGGFFSPDLRAVDHYFWTNPLSFNRISRGVGRSSIRVAVPRRKASGRGARQQPARMIRLARHHQGVDFAAPIGTPVVAVADGTVSHQGRSGAFGNLIVLSHPGGYTTYYAHLTDYANTLRPGTDVRRGMEIGYVGSTGRSTGPHLHFEIRQAGRYLDPLDDDVDNGPWMWQVSDRLPLLRQLLLTDALAASRPLPAPPGDGRTTMHARRCLQQP